MTNFAIKRTCRECPWKRSNAPGKFAPERYRALAPTANRSFNGFPQPVFACHMTHEGEEMACAGFLLVVGFDNISVRVAAVQKRLDLSAIESDSELYGSYDEMATANGCVESTAKS